MNDTSEVELYDVKVPRSQLESVQKVAEVLYGKTIPYGRVGYKECVQFALYTIEEWESRVLRAEQI